MLLRVDNLSVVFETQRGPLRAVERLSLSLDAGETLGIVGESGSGKSVTSLALMGLLAPNARVTADCAEFDGLDLLGLSERGLRRLRGGQIGMIFQDPMTSLNPSFTVGYQLDEALKAHGKGDRRARKRRAVELLERVGIADPEHRLQTYPFELSGGLCQRVMIAMALACEPRLLIADEPTTALDVTIQAQILDLLRDLRRERGLALILITHDLGVVAQNTERLAVMYAGEVVESGLTREILESPKHPYTAGLLRCLPSRNRDLPRDSRLPSIPGLVPDLVHRPSSCAFHPRCPKGTRACVEAPPPWKASARCLFPMEGAS